GNRRMRWDHRGRAVAVGDGAQAWDRAEPVADKVLAGKDSENPRGGCSSARIYRADPRMGMRRAQHEGIGLAWPVDVVEIGAATSDETLVLDTADRLTDAELLHGTSPPIRISAARIGFATTGSYGFHRD